MYSFFRNSESKKNQGSHEVTETVFSTEVHSVKHSRVPSTKGKGSLLLSDTFNY